MPSAAASGVAMTEVRGCLVVSMPDDATDDMFTQMFQAIAQKLVAQRLTAMILDFSGVQVLDLHEFDRVRKLSRTAELLGARVALVALHPGIVAFLAQTDTDVHDMQFCLQMEDAFTKLASAA